MVYGAGQPVRSEPLLPVPCSVRYPDSRSECTTLPPSSCILVYSFCRPSLHLRRVTGFW